MYNIMIVSYFIWFNSVVLWYIDRGREGWSPHFLSKFSLDGFCHFFNWLICVDLEMFFYQWERLTCYAQWSVLTFTSLSLYFSRTGLHSFWKVAHLLFIESSLSSKFALWRRRLTMTSCRDKQVIMLIFFYCLEVRERLNNDVLSPFPAPASSQLYLS